MRIDPAWVSLAWHYLAQCTEWNSVMGSDVTLSCWNKPVGWSHSPVEYGVGGGALCAKPPYPASFSHSCRAARRPLSTPTRVGVPLFFQPWGLGRGEATPAAGRPPDGGWLVCLCMGLRAWCLIIYVSVFFFSHFPPVSPFSFALTSPSLPPSLSRCLRKPPPSGAKANYRLIL